MKDLEEFIKTVAKLRAPDGCPWDREQDHKSLKRYLIEETYETIDAIDNGSSKELMEELGDVLLQVVLHAQIAEEEKRFNIHDVARFINEKMISRHPHVFGDVKVKDSTEVLKNWEELKKREKPERKDIFDGIPNSLPALLKAYKVSKKAAKEGFEWESESQLWSAFDSELKEFKESLKSENKEEKIEEFGDLLFMICNLARWYKIEPEETLNFGIKKFIKRYNKVKDKVHSLSKEVKDVSPHELNGLWDMVKKEEKS